MKVISILQILVSIGEPTIYYHTSSVKDTIVPVPILVSSSSATNVLSQTQLVNSVSSSGQQGDSESFGMQQHIDSSPLPSNEQILNSQSSPASHQREA